LRLVAGACALSAGLFVGSAAGGAIAWADESAASPNPSAEVSSPEGGSPGAPTKKVAHPLQTTMKFTAQTVTTTLRSIRKFGQQYSSSKGPGETASAATNTVVDTEVAPSAAVDPSAPVTDPDADAPDATTLAAETAPGPPPATNPLAPAATVAGPVANAVGTVAGVAGSVPGALLALSGSPTPVTDAITTVTEMLTSVTNAVIPLTQLPSDLYTMFSVPTVTATTTISGGVDPGAGAPVLGARASQGTDAAPIILAGGMALPADIAPLATLGDIPTAGLNNALPASGIAAPARDVISQSALGSFLEHTVTALFVPASLSALAAVALPGVGGLLIICALGMRIGYRQAKALFEVRRAGIAAFAGPGPLGVVRSGSLVALSPRALGIRPDRALRVVPSGTSRVSALQDRAA
jgi:hypothetical protein